ncbi:cysteine-tryptophan domain-containing zinc finger protein 7-like isoform X2 [Phoenix dactylifera]|uniref:Cysteine-tryptophan domain-containing zinc finger protein 7-like isoform X2 n=1 Tax=Phoenix dactylifera TaxID=42345 RepID=A0A8B9APK3_PHODC|nr:cysteine-tryptophan domain-containing zinc finger protein 7-like isoform X2 [Phoenix dactylifera]
MPSVRGRDEGRKEVWLGFWGMGENELEEGEACSEQEEEDDSCIDPDIALSYIDEKLQNVLGHFQKDFEGGVSAENLGAKFGGYGSFLPTYQHSPSILSQSKSPPRAPNHNAARSPYAPSFEGTCKNPSIQMGSSHSKNNTTSAPPLDNSSKKDMGTSTHNNEEPIPQHDSLNKPVNGSDRKTLKVRIKVGPDNILARNNAAIYSGLGLDMSPSSSLEDSPDWNGGLSLQFHHMPDESPRAILQMMTCSPVPGVILLSPLQVSLFQLTEKESAFTKNKTGMLYKGIPDKCAVLGDLTLPVKDVKCYNEKKMRLSEKRGKSTDIKNLKHKDDMRAILNREIDIETPAGQELISDALDIPTLSALKDADRKTERLIVRDSVKGVTGMLDHSKEPKKITMKERIPSPDLVRDKQMESMESMENNGVGNLGNETTCSKGKLNSKTIMAEKDLEERNTNSHKGTSFDLQRENRSKLEKSYDLVNASSNIFKGRKEHMAGPVNHIKQISSQTVTSCEQEGEKIFQGKGQLFEGKRKLKGSQTDAAPLVELSKDNLSGQSSASLRENKKNSHTKVNHSEKKSKVLKSCTDLSKNSFTESRDDATGYDVNQEQLESGTGLPDFHYKDKLKVLNYEHEKEPFISIGTSKGRPGDKKVDNLPISDGSVNESATMPLMGNAPASGAAAATHAPVVIEENWVCCDICQQWRLLPYGANPDHLPKNWQCSLLSWLPGMNSCKFSEEETTKALNALYLIPVPESGASLEGHHNVAASSITSNNSLHLNQKLEHNMQTVPAIGKRKTGPKDASNVLNCSTQFSDPGKRKRQALNKSGSLNDVNQYPCETNLSDKAGLSHASKSNDFTAEKQKKKQKEKHKNLGCYSNGGDFIERSEKYSKPKSKRVVDQNDFGALKKIKKEGSQYPVKDCYPDHDIAGKAGTCMVNDLSTNVVNDLQKHGDVSFSKDLKCKSKGSLSSSLKRLNDEVQFLPNGDIKEQFSASDVEKSKKLDLAAKKKKLKEWQDDQHNQEAQATVNEVLSETEMLKLKKARVSKSEGKESSTGRIDKKCSSTRIVLPASREHLSDGMDEEGRYAVGKVHQLGLCQGNATSRQVLDLIDPLKRDIAYAQACTAATSSSSKVSSSHKSKANFQETKGSPVESVSSSPLRFLNTEKLFNKTNSVVKDDALNVGSSILGSPKICSDSEADGGSNRSGKRRKETACSAEQRHIENHRAADSGVLNPVRGSFYHQDREANKLPGGKAEVGMHLKRVSHDGLSPTEFEEINVVSATRNFMDRHSEYPHGHRHTDHNQDLEKLNKHHQVNGSGRQKSGKSSSSWLNERYRSSKSNLDNGKLKSSGSSSGNKDLYSMKSGSGCQQMVDLDSHQRSTYLEDLRDGNYNFPEKDEKDFSGKKDSATRCSSGKRDNGVQDNLDTHGPSMLYNQHKDLDSRVAVLGAKSNIQDDLQLASSYNDEESSNHIISNLIDQGELLAKTGKAHSILSSGDKQETHSRSPQNSSPVKGSRSELPFKDAGNTGASKAGKQSRQPDIQNGVHHNSLRQAAPNDPDTSSPIRKDSHCTANIVMKEARDLKHTANRLKSEGLELESTGLYFQAALKFLHYASLMEPLSFDSAKQGDTSHSMQMYFETAKLCKFCAHEYERCKEMAAAALAYKCVEVAYLKSAYYKYPSASKDQQELQTALQILQPDK